MSPILGIYASQISGHLVPPNSYASIQTVTVGSGGASSITFSSIPSTYTHLQIRGIAQSAATTFIEDGKIQFNGDTGSNYIRHALMGNGASVAAYSTSSTGILVDAMVSGTVSGTANIFADSVIDILDYTNTNKNKTMRMLSGYDANGSGSVRLTSSAWFSTAAINIFSVDIGNYWATGSRIDLYGISTSNATGA